MPPKRPPMRYLLVPWQKDTAWIGMNLRNRLIHSFDPDLWKFGRGRGSLGRFLQQGCQTTENISFHSAARRSALDTKDTRSLLALQTSYLYKIVSTDQRHATHRRLLLEPPRRALAAWRRISIDKVRGIGSRRHSLRCFGRKLVREAQGSIPRRSTRDA